MELIRTGKVKEVYDEGNTLLFKFTDKISVFDKIIPNKIPDKGESLCRTSAFWFQLIKEKKGIDSHYIDCPSMNEMRVRKFHVDESGGSKIWINYLVPLEFVMRYYVAGTLMDRIKKGKVNFHELGFKVEPKIGDKLPDPLFEMTTKFEKTDRPLSTVEASEIGGLRRDEILEIKELILRIDSVIDDQISKRGLIHADGKKEFAMGEGRNPIVVDTFGTADEDRFWDKQKFEEGKLVELSKESVRQYYRSSGYYDLLYSSRENGNEGPEIQPLPENLIKETSSLYREMYSKLTGQKW
ncbi:MAG: phosphoribosylaminoimidazolesuccinocarboxamide synthase [Thermoplasmataceae archaeon]